MAEPRENQRGARQICDYEGSGYKQDFWVGQGREYEDLTERIALGSLLPSAGGRLLELGAGFGRLADLYRGYGEVFLLDYSSTLLQDAAATMGDTGRFRFVAADLYDLPFQAGQFDAVVMVRVIHHLVDVPRALQEIGRVLGDGGILVLEFANKRNLKAIARYLLRRQGWSPFSPEPYPFVKLNYNFHPDWIRERLQDAGLVVESQRSLSHFRLPLLKRLLPARVLAWADRVLQPTGTWWQLTPSVMLRARKGRCQSPETGGLWRCLACGDGGLEERQDSLVCTRCGRLWPVRCGIIDFKPPHRMHGLTPH